MSNIYLKLSWWNTGLSPLGKNRTTSEQMKIGTMLINALLSGEGVDLLGLAEVSLENVQIIVNNIDREKYDLFIDNKTFGRLKFDVAAIYNKKELIYLNHHSLIDFHGKMRFKVATRIDFQIRKTWEILHIFLCHWPSRLRGEDAKEKRNLISHELRKEIIDLKNKYNLVPKVIVMGDFNDEPFDRSLSFYLLATRDRTIAKNNNEFFYNPFWRMLGERNSFPKSNDDENICGTYYYRNGHETKWRTFDQIILSSNFLNKNDWHLNEDFTKIWQESQIVNFIKKGEIKFDHLPIVTVIQKREN